MSSQRAYYSVVQYVPDRFRAEAVNVGLVLLRLQPHSMRMRMTDNFDRARRLFRVGQHELKNLEMFVSGFRNRIESSAEEFRTAEALAAFAAARANDLRMTAPRLAMVEIFEADFERLFSEVVDEPPITAASEKPS